MKILYSFISLLTVGTLLGCDGYDSELKIVNGRAVLDDEYQQVVLIENCAGTFVDHNTMVTAAHCVVDKEGKPKDYTWAYVQNEYVWSTSIAIHPQYTITDRNGVNQFDVAVVKFPDQTSAYHTPVCELGPDKKMTGVVVGWGCNDATNGWARCEGMGLKRAGYALVHLFDENMLEIMGRDDPVDDSGYAASTGLGDSGGPMFFHDCLGAVTSGGTKIGSKPYSYMADLTQGSVKDFLKTNEVSVDHRTFDKVDQCISDKNGIFSFYRIAGDCKKGRTESWLYEGNFGSSGVFKGKIESYCDGNGKAQETGLPIMHDRQDLLEFSIKWSSEEKSQWTAYGPSQENFKMECVVKK